MKEKSEETVLETPSFLSELLNTSSPSGFEYQAQAVLDKYVKPDADLYKKDSIGNRISVINPDKKPNLMLAGHMDEIGLMVSHVSKDGFLYFDAIGGHDVGLISGRKVSIFNKNGTVSGVTGKRAVHLLEPDERKQAPKIHKIWIDIGAKTKEEALERISIGDPIVYEQAPFTLKGNMICSKGIDDKAGAFLVCEVLRRLAKEKNNLDACVTAVATTQEEIGTRGAIVSSYHVNPDVGIAVDVCHATDAPDHDNTKYGEIKLGSGPVISRGANINPKVFDRLVSCAEKNDIPYQVEAAPGVTGTDARSLQMSRSGVATALISIPLRYMHTPIEIAHLQDIENTIKLIASFAKTLKPSDDFSW